MRAHKGRGTAANSDRTLLLLPPPSNIMQHYAPGHAFIQSGPMRASLHPYIHDKLCLAPCMYLIRKSGQVEGTVAAQMRWPRRMRTASVGRNAE